MESLHCLNMHTEAKSSTKRPRIYSAPPPELRWLDVCRRRVVVGLKLSEVRYNVVEDDNADDVGDDGLFVVKYSLAAMEFWSLMARKDRMEFLQNATSLPRSIYRNNRENSVLCSELNKSVFC